jgi:hypothetical protein
MSAMPSSRRLPLWSLPSAHSSANPDACQKFTARVSGYLQAELQRPEWEDKTGNEGLEAL